MSPNEAKNFIKEAFINVLENTNADEETYAHYFSKDYIQHVDGKTLDYSHFVAHMHALKSTVKSVKIIFKNILVEDDKIATIHIVNAIKQDGSQVEVQVNALMQIKNNKIIFCDELTHVIHGEESDKDLGSRY